jgi:hypothetical protein
VADDQIVMDPNENDVSDGTVFKNPREKGKMTLATHGEQSPAYAVSENLHFKAELPEDMNGIATRAEPDESMDQPVESEPSGSEYENEDVDDDNEEEEEEIELEDDEPDTRLKRRKQGGKKQKKGLAAREQINDSVAAIMRVSDDALVPRPHVEGFKRKTGNDFER